MDSKIIMLSVLTAFCCSETAYAQRSVQTLKKNWQFSKGEVFNAKSAETVSVPHDWAIYGPFDRKKTCKSLPLSRTERRRLPRKPAGRAACLLSGKVSIARVLRFRTPQARLSHLSLTVS